GGAFRVGIHQAAPAGAAQRVADIEGHSVGADDGEILAVSEGDWTVFGYDRGVEHRSHDPHVAPGDDAHAGSESGLDGELRSVFAGDEQTTLFHEFAQVLEAVVAEAGTNVIGGVATIFEIGGDLRFLPGHRVVPHRKAIDEVESGAMTDGGEDDDIVL